MASPSVEPEQPTTVPCGTDAERVGAPPGADAERGRALDGPAPRHRYRRYAVGSGPYEHYAAMRAGQTRAYVARMERKWCGFDHARMPMRAAIAALDGYVDASDPDTALPNALHGLQAAEAARAAGEPDWLQLTCLIHDVGKVMGVLDPCVADGCTADGPQWGIAGDTSVVGRPLPASAVLPHLRTADVDDAYAPGCGLRALRFAFGHDEYLYRVLVHNATTLPAEALAMVRYHSCYPLHSGGAYADLLAPGDAGLLAWVRRFNRYDLYTKRDAPPDAAALWPYYDALIAKYLPPVLEW